jgi:hypothetical protein
MSASATDRCPRCAAPRSASSPERCPRCGYRYRGGPDARRDRLARWDPWLGVGVPVSIGAVVAAIGVSGDDPLVPWIGLAIVVIGAPLGWLIGQRSRA